MGANLINSKGELLLEQNKQFIYRLGSSVMVVQDHHGAVFMNKKLDILIPSAFRSIQLMGGVLLVTEKKSDQQLVLNQKGAILFKPEGFELMDATNKYIIVRKRSMEGTKKGLIDFQGNWLLEPKYDYLSTPFNLQPN